MKFVDQQVELITQDPGLEGIFKSIEMAARTCYASESSSITAEEFVKKLISSKHLTPLEFGTVYLFIPGDPLAEDMPDVVKKYHKNPYSKVNIVLDKGTSHVNYYITTNYRVLLENHYLSDLEYLSELTEFHYKRVTFRVATSEGVARELNRYRKLSICQRSTRYCNYTKKFGEIEFIKPYWWETLNSPSQSYIKYLLEDIEWAYGDSISEQKLQPQMVRDLLPLCTKTVVMYCGFESDWDHVMAQRHFELTGKAHPACKEVADLMYKYLN